MQTFRKSGDPKIIAIEYKKSQLASALGINTGLYYVPKVINYDKNKGLLEFEYLSELTTIFNLLNNNDKRLYRIFNQIGNALATIHSKLVLPDNLKNKLPKDWIDSTNNVFIHGDLTTANVCFHEPTKKLVILDWSTSPFINGTMTFGTTYFDIHWFIRSMFISMPLKSYSLKLTNELILTFIKSYFSSQNYAVNKDKYLHYQKLIYNLSHQVMWRRQNTRPWNEKILYLCKYFMTYNLWRTNKPNIYIR